MKTELEVARDAVRSAGLEELADALEWAAAAVRHRATLLSAARWAAGESDMMCPDCGHRSVHDRKCPTAEALHVLDSEWSVEEVAAARSEAAHWAPRRLWPMPALGGHYIPPRPPFDSTPGLEAAMRAAASPEEARAIIEEYYRRERLHIDPARLEWTAPIIPSQQVTFGPPRVRPDGDLLMGMMRVAASPQPAQPQPEDEPADVTPPANPPPAR